MMEKENQKGTGKSKSLRTKLYCDKLVDIKLYFIILLQQCNIKVKVIDVCV